jgi:hypothetical protein
MRRALFLNPLCLLLGLMAAAGPAHAVELGERYSARLDMLGRQVPLPEGDWVVLGRGSNTLTSGNPGAYGTIENVLLARRTEGRIDGLVEINMNRLPVGGGWGSAGDCAREDGLARVAFYKTAVDGFCLFVVPTELGVAAAPGPQAWATVETQLHQAATPPTPIWLTVGFRISDRRDVLDVRYHLDPDRLGFSALSKSDWSVKAVLAAPKRFSAVSQLTAWGGLAAGVIEDGFRGALVSEPAAALPNPWEVSIPKQAVDAVSAGGGQGRVSRSARIAALDELAASGAISAADRAAYLKAIMDVPPPPTPDDYYRLLGAKVVSFNFFRVSVDYILAFVVTVNTLVSGYITATIVATHSVAQVFNDMWWDNYIATQAKATASVVDFVYIGVPREAVAS